jgi:hypothetical protein
LKDKNFEIISVAQDTGGAKDAGPWIAPLQYPDSKPDLPKDTIETARKIGPLTYTVLIDEKASGLQAVQHGQRAHGRLDHQSATHCASQ